MAQRRTTTVEQARSSNSPRTRMEAGRQACCTHSQELTGTVLTAILPSMPRGISTVQRPRVEAALSVLEVVALSLGFHLTRMEAGQGAFCTASAELTVNCSGP